MHDFQLIDLLFGISRRLARQLAPIYHARGLSGSELVVLWKIHQGGPHRVTELAEETNISPSTLTGILDRLVSQGWLERTPDPSDRRGILMQASPRLQVLMRELASSIEARLESIFSSLPAGTYQRVLADLQQLLKHLEGEKDD